MRLGILDMVGLATSLVFAIPVGMYGLERAFAGDLASGGFFLVVAVLMVYLPRKLTTPQDLPGKVAEEVVGNTVGDPDDAESTEK